MARIDVAAIDLLRIADALEAVADRVAAAEASGDRPAQLSEELAVLLTDPRRIRPSHAGLLAHVDQPYLDAATSRAVREVLRGVATRFAEQLPQAGNAFEGALAAWRPGQVRDRPLRAVVDALHHQLDTHPVWVAALAAGWASSVQEIRHQLDVTPGDLTRLVTGRAIPDRKLATAEGRLRRGEFLPASVAIPLLGNLLIFAPTDDPEQRSVITRLAEALESPDLAAKQDLIRAVGAPEAGRAPGSPLERFAVALVQNHEARLPDPFAASTARDRRARPDRQGLISIAQEILHSPLGPITPSSIEAPDFLEDQAAWSTALVHGRHTITAICVNLLVLPDLPSPAMALEATVSLLETLSPPPYHAFERAVCHALIQRAGDGGLELAKAAMLRELADGAIPGRDRLAPVRAYVAAAQKETLADRPRHRRRPVEVQHSAASRRPGTPRRTAKDGRRAQ